MAWHVLDEFTEADGALASQRRTCTHYGKVFVSLASAASINSQTLKVTPGTASRSVQAEAGASGAQSVLYTPLVAGLVAFAELDVSRWCPTLYLRLVNSGGTTCDIRWYGPHPTAYNYSNRIYVECGGAARTINPSGGWIMPPGREDDPDTEDGTVDGTDVVPTTGYEMSIPIALAMYVRKVVDGTATIEIWTAAPSQGTEVEGQWQHVDTFTTATLSEVSLLLYVVGNAARPGDYVRVRRIGLGTDVFDPADRSGWRLIDRHTTGVSIASGMHVCTSGAAVAVSAYNSAEWGAAGDVRVFRSIDAGHKTWTRGTDLWVHDATYTYGSCALIGRGNTLAAFANKAAVDNSSRSLVCRVSTDAGVTWADSAIITTQNNALLYVERNGIVTRGGLWVLPFHYNGQFAIAYASDPSGEWAVAYGVCAGLEPVIAEVGGKLVGLLRADYYPRIIWCHDPSNPAATNWGTHGSAAAPDQTPTILSGKAGEGASRIPSSTDSMDLIAVDGVLYLFTLGTYSVPRRQAVLCYQSSDNGQTWTPYPLNPIIRHYGISTQQYSPRIGSDGRMYASATRRNVGLFGYFEPIVRFGGRGMAPRIGSAQIRGGR